MGCSRVLPGGIFGPVCEERRELVISCSRTNEVTVTAGAPGPGVKNSHEPVQGYLLYNLLKLLFLNQNLVHLLHAKKNMTH